MPILFFPGNFTVQSNFQAIFFLSLPNQNILVICEVRGSHPKTIKINVSVSIDFKGLWGEVIDKILKDLYVTISYKYLVYCGLYNWQGHKTFPVSSAHCHLHNWFCTPPSHMITQIPTNRKGMAEIHSLINVSQVRTPHFKIFLTS